jgi:signal transduction histidine kinase
MGVTRSSENGREPPLSFGDSTCEQLLDLLLGMAVSLDADVQEAHRQRLSELSSTDWVLNHWLNARLGNDWNASDSHRATFDWDTLLRSLAGCPGTSAATSRLRQAVNVVIRLRAFQSTFVTQLDDFKSQAIYQFSYGLSHELNNPLANIVTRASQLLRTSPLPDDQLSLETIIENAMRGCEMLGDLMLIARPPEINRRLVDSMELGQQIQERGTHWAQLRMVNLQVHWAIHQQLRLDATLIKEAVWAVLRNAIEASSTEQWVWLHARLDANMLMIRIDDQGTGLSPDALEHCFDPYYSGREAGRGLGLGLTKAKRLSTLHGGGVGIANRTGGGCQARLWFAVG